MVNVNTILRNKWLQVLSAITLILIALLAVMPVVIERMAVAWLEDNGADRAKIGNIDLNIFSGRVGLFDLEVDKAGEAPLRIWRLTVDVDWSQLLRKRFFVSSIWLYEADLLIQQQEDGNLVIGGIQFGGESEAVPQAEASEDKSGFLDRWGVGINSFAIRNSTIRYQSSQFDERVDINSLYVLNALSWEPEDAARIHFDMLVNQQPVTLFSDTRVFRDAPDTSSTLQLVKLDLSHYEAIAKQAGIDELRGLLSLNLVLNAVYETDKHTRVTLDADLNLDDFRVRQGDLSIEQKSLRFESQSTLNFPASAGELLAAGNGRLTIQDQTVNIGDISAHHAQLTWMGNASAITAENPETPMAIQLDGDASVVDLQVDDVKAKVTLAMAKHVDARKIAVKAPDDVKCDEISVSDLKALLQTGEVSQPQLPQIRLAAGSVQNAQFNNSIQSASVTRVKLDKLEAQTADKQLQLAQIQALIVDDVVVNLQERLSIKAVTIDAVQALAPMDTSSLPKESAVTVSRTQLNNLQFQFKPQALRLQSVGVDGLKVLVRRAADGSIYAVDKLAAASPASDEPHGETAIENEVKKESPFVLNLDSVNIGGQSKIRIVDQSVSPHFTASIAPLDIVVNQVYSDDPNSKTQFNINTSLNPGNQFTANGWLTPFAEKRDADINVDVKALDLVMFSPYAVKAAGYMVRSGRLNAAIKGGIDDDRVNANTTIVAQRLKLDATSEAARGQSIQNLDIGMPIDAALALMKDKNGDIKMEVPVSGDLRDPNFAIGPAFRGAMTQAIKKASITYAAYALQPYGSVLLGAQMLNKAMALRLESVQFEAGEAQLNSRATNYLEKIAGLMNDRPGISITLCGNATEEDRNQLHSRNVANLEDELVKLAQQRGNIVKNHLIEEYNIAADRFFDCQPEVSRDETAQPEVKLGL